MNLVENFSRLSLAFHEMASKQPKLATSIFLRCVKGGEASGIVHIKHSVKEMKTEERLESIKLFAKAVKDVCDHSKEIKQDDIPTMLLLVDSSRKSIKKLRNIFKKDVDKILELGGLTSALSDLSKTIKGIASQKLDELYPPGAEESAPPDKLREKHYRLGKELLQDVSSAKKATKLRECLSFGIRNRLSKMIADSQSWRIPLPQLPSPLPMKFGDLAELEKRINGSRLEFMQQRYVAAVNEFDAWAGEVQKKGKIAYVDDIIDMKRQELKECKMQIEMPLTTVGEYAAILMRAKGMLNSVAESRVQKEKLVQSALQALQQSPFRNFEKAKRLEKKGKELLGHLRDSKRRLSELEADMKEVGLYRVHLFNTLEPKRSEGVPQSEKESDAALLLDEAMRKFRKQKLKR